MKSHSKVCKRETENGIFWEYNGVLYPDRLTKKNAMENIKAIALKYCEGGGLDIGAGRYPFHTARAIMDDKTENAYKLPSVPDNELDYIFSSHCLEHLERPWEALDLWIRKLKRNGILFLYLPHIDMELWRPGAPWVGHQHKWSPTFEKVKNELEFRGMSIIAGDGDKDNLWSWYIVATKAYNNPSGKPVDEEYITKFFWNKTVLVLGSAPNVLETETDFMDSFDLIVRVNNYKNFNSCRRTDVYASFFGKSIRKDIHNLRQDGVRLLMAKCPDDIVEVKNPDGSINTKLSEDFRWIYEFRNEWFKVAGIPLFIQTVENFNNNNIPIKQICTTGVAIILDILRCKPKHLYFAGFDFAMSGMHNINKRMIIKPEPNCHHFEDEFYYMREKVRTLKNLDCSPAIKKLFENPYSRGK